MKTIICLKLKVLSADFCYYVSKFKEKEKGLYRCTCNKRRKIALLLPDRLSEIRYKLVKAKKLKQSIDNYFKVNSTGKIKRIQSLIDLDFKFKMLVQTFIPSI